MEMESLNKEVNDESKDIRISKKELLEYLKDHIKHSETMPPHVRHSFVTYVDLDAALSLIYAIFKAQD